VGDFFRSWRRKTGCALLILACVLTSAWIRSQQVIDIVSFPAVPSFSNGIGSGQLISWNRGVIWALVRNTSGEGLYLPRLTTLYSSNLAYQQITEDLDENVFNNPLIQWKIRFNGIGYGESDATCNDGSRNLIFLVPYCCMVTPLTLISAWLLLSKSRPSKTKERVPS
jgi:hypothetical protein